ncbi:insulin receptor-like [Drosophila innubila]|uniref:insulin receptor-like n=1 Tax=Drosophila innubila TaxID=198719 RepID=UPI00148BD7A3|nr:insulin receptor-like [Drosophila innubila]
MFLYMAYLLLTVVTFLLMATNGLSDPLTEHKECKSLDIRTECKKMHLLDNCTAITGSLMITLFPKSPECNFSLYSFPKLREITGFVIFTEVLGLRSIRNMFPNLTVIRGRQLFLNYALGVTTMDDLELLEFPSLVAIQRGHVYISDNQKLCQLNGINADRLTLSTGENHIVMGSKNCTQSDNCKGCDSNFCWSNLTCQRFENDNLAHFDRNSENCHEECLGGCYNATAAGCVVCRGLTNAGECVKQCPADKYLLEQYQRCYTRDECLAHPGHFTFGFDCVTFCPGGYKPNTEMECVKCDPQDPCISVCSPEYDDKYVRIFNLADADKLRGCQIINGSLIIKIRSQVDELQLEQSLRSLREIRGHLKISRSSQLISLRFLRNLRRIHGNPLENRHYAFVLYDNKQLTELWEPTKQLEFETGGMFMHRNNKLCNKHMRDFQDRVRHDKVLDSLQTSDQEVLCGPAKLQLRVQARSHRTMMLSWPKEQTSVELELIYRMVPFGETQVTETDLEAPICTRINWQRLLLFVDDLRENGTHYSYQLEQLHPNTRYACLLRTFGGDLQHEARSELIYVQTQRDIPKSPLLAVTKKTDTSLSLSIGAQDQEYFVLNVFELPDDEAYMDERNFCKQPPFLWQDMDAMRWRSIQEYDYDDCCAHQEELADDQHFIDEMSTMYRCSLDAPENCATLGAKQLQLAANTTTYDLRNLERYRLYSLQLQACNKFGCSSVTTLNERTNFTLGADSLTELTACRVPKTTEYIMRFPEPSKPNGLVVNYVLHYRNNVSNEVVETHLSCLTRRDHADAKFVHVNNLNGTYNEGAVRVHSLAGDVITPFVAITWCDLVK